jgi:hypothetical protein
MLLFMGLQLISASNKQASCLYFWDCGSYQLIARPGKIQAEKLLQLVKWHECIACPRFKNAGALDAKDPVHKGAHI